MIVNYNCITTLNTYKILLIPNSKQTEFLKSQSKFTNVDSLCLHNLKITSSFDIRNKECAIPF